jgi:signal transduction histidine kinase
VSGAPVARVSGPEIRLLRRAAWRLGLQVAGSGAVIVLVLAGLALFIVLRGQQSAADGLLRQAAISAEDTVDPPAGTWLIVERQDRCSATGGLPGGLPVAAALRQVTSTGVAENEQVTVGGAAYQVYTVRPDVLVLGTRGGLRRALVSLLDNAVRHARTTVEVTVHRRGPDVLVDVSDDGPGIDPAIVPHLFERFAAGSGQVTERRHYGIGLALVSEIAARHGGSISVQPEPRGGPTLRLTLPAHTPSR